MSRSNNRVSNVIPGPEFPVQVYAVRIDPLDLYVEGDYERRPPTWRWLTICQHSEEETTPSRSDDAYVHKGLEYHKRFLKLSLPGVTKDNGEEMTAGEIRKAKRELVSEFGDLAIAHNLYDLAGTERWILEALICAGVHPGVIADDIPTRQSVIETYEALFYDVRSRLHAHGFVEEQVLRNWMRRGSYGAEEDLLWTEAAYSFGRDVFYQLMRAGKLTREHEEELKEAIRSNTLRDQLLQQMLRPINMYTSALIAEEFAAMRTHEAATTTANQLTGQVSQGVDIVVSSIKFAHASLRIGSGLTAFEARPAACMRRLEERGYIAAGQKALTE